MYLVVVLLTEKGEGDAGKNNTADYAWGDRPTDWPVGTPRSIGPAILSVSSQEYHRTRYWVAARPLRLADLFAKTLIGLTRWI